KAKLTDIFLQVKINGDMALLQAIEKLLLEEEENNPGSVFDREFIRNHTNGYAELTHHLKKLNIIELEKASGVPLEQIIEVADALKNKTKIIACWAMGLT